MGLKADNAQLGQSATASQNFNLRAPLDGTLRLSRGNAGAEISDPIKIESNNDITLLGNVLSGVLGTGQTWQNFIGSRSLGVTYTNTTGKPIALQVGTGSSAVSNCRVSVSGNLVFGSDTTAGYTSQAFAIIPPGGTYIVTVSAGAGQVNSWSELR